MKNSLSLKNELIFSYASGTTSLAKSLMASTYLYLNSREVKIYNEFEDYCGEELKNISQIKTKNLNAEKCMVDNLNDNKTILKPINPINKFLKDLGNLEWKKIFSGFYEHEFKLSKKENAKLIKMDPSAKVPLHSHSGKEYILVLDGSFSDEYGTYLKGDLQVNDSQIKHTPVACKNKGCICLTITEDDLIFYGPMAPILNIITFFKSIILKT